MIRRRTLLFSILGIAVIALALERENEFSPPVASTVSGVADAGPTGHHSESNGSSIALALPERRLLSESTGTAFSSWQPPSPPRSPEPVSALEQVPEPKASIPQMPYSYAGWLEHGEKAEVFVSRNGVVIAVKEGDILEGGYRVESIEADLITLVYLPLGHRETTARASPGKPMSEPARLVWQGPQQVKMGGNFSVALHVSSDEPLHASPFRVRFDPTVLESVAVQPGKFYGDERGGGFIHRVRADGTILIEASSLRPEPAKDAQLVVLTFKPIKAVSDAELSVEAMTLQGPAGQAIRLDGPSSFKTAITP